MKINHNAVRVMKAKLTTEQINTFTEWAPPDAAANMQNKAAFITRLI